MPRLWRRFLPAAEANRIAAAHLLSLNELGYRIDPDPQLDEFRADSNWIELVGGELASDLQRLRSVEQTLAEADDRIENLTAELATMREELIRCCACNGFPSDEAHQ
jgi:hypothetical protein